MPLILRLHHRNQSSDFRFDEHAHAQPIIVGRTDEADLVVPARRVGVRHCAFFVVQGRWVIQDGNTQAGTRINGGSLPGSRAVYPVSSGDVVTLGDAPTPPTLTILQADTTPPGRRPAQPPARTVRQPTPQRTPQPGPQPAQAPPLQQVTPAVEGAAPAEAFPSPFQEIRQTRISPRRRRPSHSRMGPAGWALLIISSLALISTSVLIGLLLWQQQNPPRSPGDATPSVTPAAPPAAPASRPFE